MRNEIIHTEERNGYRIEIEIDPEPQNPREWDNLGTMVCRHRRHNLGDKGAKMPEMEEVTSDWVALQLHLYDHSGITMRTTPFTDVDPQCWDSGQVGMIYASPEKIRKEYKLKADDPISPEIATEVRKVLEQEVKTYDQFLRGNVWGYRVIEVDTGTERDACWGFFQNERPAAEDSYVLKQARESADAHPPGNKLTVRKIVERYEIATGAQASVLVAYLRARTDERAKVDAAYIEGVGDWKERTLKQLIIIEDEQ